MGRRQYRQDLATAAQNPPPHIGNIHSPDDGEIAFSYNYSQGGVNHVAQLQLLALNVDDYPRENEYMIFARDTEASPPIANVISILSPILANRSITDALSEISNCLYQAVTKGKSSNPILLDSSDVDEEDPGAQDEEEGDDWLEDDDDATFGLDQSTKLGPITIGRTSMSHMAAENRQKVKADLVQAKSAGFKIGIIGDLNSSGIVCVSIRVSKLGISEEVMKAWGLEARQYLVLLIRLQYGYRSIESLKEESILAGATEIRLGLCYSYKPDPQSAFDSFNELAQKTTVESQVTKLRSSTSLQALFIGRPLNELFRGRFTRIVKFRDVYQLGWTGAEQLVHDTQGAIADTKGMEKYDRMCDNEVPRALPEIVMQDTMSDRPIKDCSLPLVAMQFALRHFVRCTEFCLVCHCSSGSTFEALKPYVCSNPLCLYQYMGLGFGPSIEWEILSQPYVVDLLISFCYAQAQGGRLKEFPDGIDLRVPVLPQYCKDIGAGIGYHHYGQQAEAQGLTKSSTAQKSFTAPYSPEKCELWFTTDEADTTKQLRTGDFIALSRPANINGVVYHRIEDVMSPVVMLGPPVLTGEIASDGTRNKPTMSGYTLVDCYLFSHNFDELSKDHKAKAIMAMLDTLPPVKEMLQFLKTYSVGQDSSLRQWRDRISLSALNILRWIIASNRSCIMQVDNLVDPGTTAAAEPEEDRLTGMDDYMQFRFAQGAPDKEQRFIDCVNKETAGNPHPTIFAWHGSPLANWHSIIRQGLNFNETHHGRAFGHGVYMSPHAGTSTGYSGMQYPGRSATDWPNSALKISSAMSLNEVVNKPSSFVSSNPHYVVAEIDWIQTRYLCVKTAATHTKNNRADMETIPQDPKYRALDSQGQAKVQVPITAISKSRRPHSTVQKVEPRKRKSTGSGLNHPIELDDDDDAASVATLDEDLEYLHDDESHSGQTPVLLDSDTDIQMSDNDFEMIGSPQKRIRSGELSTRVTKLPVIQGCMLDASATDFKPGELDMTNIKILPPPDDASRAASSQLLKAFQALLKTQSTNAAHTLGWYVDPERVENMYQWIVELHSFDEEIPLAKDMKAANVNSIVLEMRFTNQYPFAPPFVRVVKPRFLPFNQGGGGHVTDGGAICMELLTNNGWSAVSSIESVLLQIRLAMSDKERPARLPGSTGGYGGGYGRTSGGGVYGVGEAIAAYERACRTHGWTVPPSFSSLQRGDETAGRY